MFANENNSPTDPYPDCSGDPYHSHCINARKEPATTTGTANAIRWPVTKKGTIANGARFGLMRIARAHAMPANADDKPEGLSPRVIIRKQTSHAAVTGTSLIGWKDW